MKIQAQIVADSLSPQHHRITSMEITFPRFILAELNTHRMFSKNSASSRAIPFAKMVKMVQENPFIPIAWQKDHKGMQGTEYITNPDEIELLRSEWLEARDHAILHATRLNKGEIASDDVLPTIPITKQLCNRLLEPFMWHKVLLTATEWENFFELRCPQYPMFKLIDGDDILFRSKKDLLKELDYDPISPNTTLDWLQINKGQAEIHMMALAEAMWDAMNESTPRQLQAGGWHIPFESKIDRRQVSALSKAAHIKRGLGKDFIESYDLTAVQISTAMCARVSYTTVGDEKEVSYETLLGIHDKMAVANPFHASPFEHCARAMSDEEYLNSVKSNGNAVDITIDGDPIFSKDSFGWCRNFRGFIQYRHILETKDNQ